MCGRAAVPQKSASISERKLSFPVNSGLRTDAKVGDPPGSSRSEPSRATGAYVVVFPSALTVFLYVSTFDCCSVRRYSTGPIGPVSVFPPGSSSTCPTGRRLFLNVCGCPLIWFTPPTFVTTCGALGGDTFSPRARIITTSTVQKNTSNDPLMNCTHVVDTIPAV